MSTREARKPVELEAAPLTLADMDRLMAELWTGYQELLANERKAAECTSQESA